MKLSIYKIVLLILISITASAQTTIWKTPDYEMTSNGIKQGKFSATALSDTELQSDYVSPQNEFISSKLIFKFSINGKDNEMKPNVNHSFNLVSGVTETPLIPFGTPLKEKSTDKETAVLPDSPLKIRLDLREVLNQIKTKGFYTTFNGDKIFKQDFKKVYVAGATAPLSWDFDNLHQKPELEMKDPDGDGIYETTLVFNSKKDKKQTDTNWKLTKNITAFPQYKSAYTLSNALYNMSLEEMEKAVEPDSTFRTGKEWAGVWTVTSATASFFQWLICNRK
ncbi:hypothetical protein [Flavobacterium sp. 3HN19-14]|uniref:hypothetical protein n=1 Tax=Flavobacterium sp. 3HN19-14 TaxID=3448133 RepID=UPI003EE3A480